MATDRDPLLEGLDAEAPAPKKNGHGGARPGGGRRPAHRKAMRGISGNRMVTSNDADYLRGLIDAENVIGDLMKHFRGEPIEPAEHDENGNEIKAARVLTQSQIQVGMSLLNKVLPNLASMKVVGTVQHKMTVVEIPAVAPSAADWEKRVDHDQRARNAKLINGTVNKDGS